MIEAKDLQISEWNGYFVREDGVITNKNDKVLKQRKNEKGYMTISLNVNSIDKFCQVHRLVAMVFIPNPELKPTVNHKDFNKSNNHVDNLEWATSYEQRMHCVANRVGMGHKRDLVGIKNPKCKVTESQVLEIRKAYQDGKRQTELSRIYGINAGAIDHIITRRTWKHL